MQIKHSPPNNGATGSDASVAVLREARRLHRVVLTDALSRSLPVLRRVLLSNTLHGMSLPELYRNRNIVQRKHILRTLAIEAGFQSWETYRATLGTMKIGQLEHFDMIQHRIGYLNFWFSTLDEAKEYALLNGGSPMRVGQQAVVVPYTT